jgi:hypothetical protein
MTTNPGFHGLILLAAEIVAQQPISVSMVTDLYIPDDNPISLLGSLR